MGRSINRSYHYGMRPHLLRYPWQLTQSHLSQPELSIGTSTGVATEATIAFRGATAAVGKKIWQALKTSPFLSLLSFVVNGELFPSVEIGVHRNRHCSRFLYARREEEGGPFAQLRCGFAFVLL